jgi:hypothetical protein
MHIRQACIRISYKIIYNKKNLRGRFDVKKDLSELGNLN